MVTTSCVLQLRPGASPQSCGYVYTGHREVSSLVTDLPGTPVTPAYRNIKYKKFYVYSDDTHTHKNSPTITPPSLSHFLCPCCFSVLSLSLEKLVTCGVIRSYNFLLVVPHIDVWGFCF